MGGLQALKERCAPVAGKEGKEETVESLIYTDDEAGNEFAEGRMNKERGAREFNLSFIRILFPTVQTMLRSLKNISSTRFHPTQEPVLFLRKI